MPANAPRLGCGLLQHLWRVVDPRDSRRRPALGEHPRDVPGSADDIGAFAALAFERPDEYWGKTLEIAGDALTPVEIAAAISRVSGRSIPYIQLPIETIRQQNPQIARAIDYLNEVGYTTDIAALRTRHPALMDFQTWLAKGGSASWALNG